MYEYTALAIISAKLHAEFMCTSITVYTLAEYYCICTPRLPQVDFTVFLLHLGKFFFQSFSKEMIEQQTRHRNLTMANHISYTYTHNT